jgi:hypothetical protein
MPRLARHLMLVEETIIASLAHYEALLIRATHDSDESEIGLSREVLVQLIHGRQEMLSRLHFEKDTLPRTH